MDAGPFRDLVVYVNELYGSGTLSKFDWSRLHELIEAAAQPQEGGGHMTATETEQRTQHALHVMDHTGDTKLVWDGDAGPEVEAAREMFDKLKGDGYLAYTVNPADGSKGDVIREFDPSAQAIIMSPQLVGG